MTRPPRDKDPSIYRLITIRTAGAQLLMRPSKDVNKTIGGVFARYAEIFGIEVYAYNFLSNHKHAFVRAPKGNIDEFEENTNREIARRINWKIHRTGKFWSRRYDDLAILTDEDLLEAFLYVTTNATKHGLVEHPSQWAGFNSYNQSLTEKALTLPFYHHSAEEEKDRVTYHTIKLTPLPQFTELSKTERISETKLLIDARAKGLVEERKSVGLGFLGVEAIKRQNPYDFPRSISRSTKPSCYTKNHEARRQFKEQERTRRDRYHEASMRYRLGELDVEFPSFTFKPPLHRKPRLLPFQPLPDDYFKNAA